MKDVLDDGLIAMGLGKYASRAKNAERLASKLEDKHGKKPNVYGSSLSGFYAGDKANKIITYNKATQLKDAFKKIPNNQTDIRVKGDLVSLPSVLQRSKKKVIDNKTGYAHGIQNLFY